MRKILSIIVLTFLLVPAYGQTFNFKNYNINDDLPQAYIYTVNQSSKGKLFVGTGEGLSIFDGDKFSTFTVNEGLSESFITSSFIDKNGLLWLGHYQGGLTTFDGTNFKSINIPNSNQSPVNTITQDITGNIWFGTQNDGIFFITLNGKLTSLGKEYSSASVNTIFCSGSDKIIAATGKGLLIINIKNKQISGSKYLLDDIHISNIFEDKIKKELWIATNEKGIFKYDIEKDTLKQVITSTNIQEKNINLIYQDNTNHLWVSVYGEGLSKFAISNDSLLRVGIYSTLTGLSNNYVKSFFIDRENNIWIGTYGGGLDQLIDPVFTLYTTFDNLPGNDITALCTSGNILWVGTKNKGVVKFSFTLKEKNDLEDTKIAISKNLPPSSITSLICFEKQTLLVGTANHGVWKHNATSGNSEQWHFIANDKLANKINQVVVDKFKNVWIATENGAYKYSHMKSKPEVYNMEKGLLHNNIRSIYIDKQNTVWFGTHGTGLSSLRNNEIINYKTPQNDDGIDIEVFEEDDEGNLWIGTYGQGLFVLKDKQFVSRYTQKDGLGSNYCYLLIKDQNNNLWIGHKNGISRFNLSTKEFFFHQKKHGFLIEETYSKAVVKDINNNLWFGTTSGLLRYNHAADKPNTVGPVVNLYELRLFFQKVDWRKYSNNLYSLYRLPSELILPHNQNHLTFGVRGISLSDPEKVSYKYKLEGFEKDWSLETNENFVTYANMPPGKYTFQAIAKNSKGTWSPYPTSFHFEILNPFWKSWWFLTLSSVLFLASIFILVRARTKSLLKRQSQLQDEKDRLLAEINEREKAQTLQKITEEKLRQTNQELNTFIYRASHDLRGPLSTVKGLTNLGIMEIKDENSLKYFNLISDRIMRLDTILKDLIHIVEITEIELEIVKIDINFCLDQVLEELLEVHTEKEYKIIKNIDPNISFFNDLKLIQIVLVNIIDNSLKYINPDNRISSISVNIKSFKDGIKIQISDDGMGIPNEIQHRVFDMFFRGTDQSKGSGLGLYLVNKIVNKLNGKIELNSQYMKGTNMEIYIPGIYTTNE